MDDFIRPKKRSPLGVKSDRELSASSEPTFIPPEELAEQEVGEKEQSMSPKNRAGTDGKSKRGIFSKRWTLQPRGKKQWAIFWTASVFFLGSVVAGWWFFLKPDTNLVDNSKPLEKVAYVPPKPKTVPSKLSGLQVDPSVNERPVTAIMIENSPEARPQSGLKDASVVFEAVAEGGITRFCALFQDTQPDYIGPVRSVRPYYIDWFMPFDASIAHVGGSPKGLADVKSLGAKDLDEFANSGAYFRISSRYAPHNAYTSIAKLNELENKKGYTSANFTGFDRKSEAASKTPNATKIDLAISSYNFNVHYDYVAANNSYNRSEGGAAHKDDRSGTQLSPKVVIAIVMQRGIDGDGQHTDYTTVGSGIMYVFQDGVVQQGTWSKSARTAQWSFTDSAGKPLTFNPGQTWISMVDTTGSVTYNP